MDVREWLRTAAITLLGAWCVLGAVDTARGLAARGAWTAGGTAARGYIGLDVGGGHAVASVRRLMRDSTVAASSGPALVLVPAGVQHQALLYLRYQLVQLEYPRRVDVLTPESVAVEPEHRYPVLVAAAGLRVPDGWIPLASDGEFIRYRRQAE